LAAFSETVLVQAPIDTVWALVSDIRRTAGLFSYMTITDYVTLAPGHWQFQRTLAIPSVATLSWCEQATVKAEGELHFHAIDGDLPYFAGLWLVAADDAGTRLTLALDYEPPTNVGPRVPASMAQYVIGEIFKSVCRHIKEAAEETAR